MTKQYRLLFLLVATTIGLAYCITGMEPSRGRGGNDDAGFILVPPPSSQMAADINKPGMTKLELFEARTDVTTMCGTGSTCGNLDLTVDNPDYISYKNGFLLSKNNNSYSYHFVYVHNSTRDPSNLNGKNVCLVGYITTTGKRAGIPICSYVGDIDESSYYSLEPFRGKPLTFLVFIGTSVESSHSYFLYPPIFWE